jgi:hypothetical protein
VAVKMKGLFSALLACLLFLLILSVVSAGEPHCKPTLDAPPMVYFGSSILFSGVGHVSSVPSPVIEGNEIRIYKSYSPGTAFLRFNKPILIGTSTTMKKGVYFFSYTPKDTAYYQAWCLYKSESDRPVTSWHSPWVKVAVKIPKKPYLIDLTFT